MMNRQNKNKNTAFTDVIWQRYIITLLGTTLEKNKKSLEIGWKATLKTLTN